ncbi:MAG: ABC transporter ATP-binding protein [Planctomycetaceae bacterium]|nr:ABC transporter ATP-binding protein [Planctomycetaceae bacterium]
MTVNELRSVDGGSWVLEQLSLLIPDVEMAAARRAWHEARLAQPGEPAGCWWKWLSVAAHSIGMRTLAIECTVKDAVRLAMEGARVICFDVSADGGWLMASPSKHGRVQVIRSEHSAEVRVLAKRPFEKLLNQYMDDGRLRCVVVRSDFSSGLAQSVSRQPFARLMALLKPEWSDIWIVMVFAFVVGLLTLTTPIAVEALVNTVAFGRFLQPVFVLALILLTFLAFAAAMRGLQTYVAELVQRRLFARIAGDLAFRLPRALTEATDSVYLPELTNRFFDVVTVQKVSAQLLLDGIALVLSAVIGMLVLAFYHPWLLGFDVVMIMAIAFIIVVLGRGAISTAIKESKNKYYMASWLEDIARCPTLFRTNGGADLALERTDRLIHEYLEARQKHFRILMRQVLFALGLQAVASTALLGIGGWLVIDGQLTLGQLVAAELIVTVIVGAFAKLGKHMESFYDLLASVDKLGNLFDLPIEPQDGLLSLPTAKAAQVVVNELRYEKNNSAMGHPEISFNAEPGQSTALLGGSGSGSDTVLDLIDGLRVPTSGYVTIDGFDPQDIRTDVLRKHVALVRREDVFHGTIEENVHLHRVDVTSADVRRSLAEVGLYDRIVSLSDGFETKLLGNGRPLCDSELTLLSLARAIAGNPRLLLIDRSLDGLPDADLDRVMNVLVSTQRPWTLIVATGKKVIAQQCDQTVELNRATRSVGLPASDTGSSIGEGQ